MIHSLNSKIQNELIHIKSLHVPPHLSPFCTLNCNHYSKFCVNYYFVFLQFLPHVSFCLLYSHINKIILHIFFCNLAILLKGSFHSKFVEIYLSSLCKAWLCKVSSHCSLTNSIGITWKFVRNTESVAALQKSLKQKLHLTRSPKDSYVKS